MPVVEWYFLTALAESIVFIESQHQKQAICPYFTHQSKVAHKNGEAASEQASQAYLQISRA